MTAWDALCARSLARKRSVLHRTSALTQSARPLEGAVAVYYGLALIVPVVAIAMVALAAAPALFRKPRALPLGALKAITTVAALFAVSALVSMAAGSPTSRGAEILGRFAILPIALLVAWRTPGFDRARAIWLGSCTGAIVAGSMAVYEVGIEGLPRARGGTNAIAFGDIALLLGLIALAALPCLTVRSRPATIASLAAFAFALTASVLSGSRGSWIALPILLWILYLQHRQGLTRLRVAGVALLTAAALLTGIQIGNGRAPERLEAAIAQTRNYVGSSQDDEVRATSIGLRVEMWRAAIDAFRDHPTLGLGWGNLPLHFQQQADAGKRDPHTAAFSHAHNQYLTSLANGGAIGALAWVALLLVPAWYFVGAFRGRTERERGMATVGLLTVAGYAVFGLTEALTESAVFVMFLATTIGLVARDIGESATTEPRSHATNRSIVGYPAAHWPRTLRASTLRIVGHR